MPTVRQASMTYEPEKTLNVADLPFLPIDLPVYDAEAKDKDGETFKYKYVEFNAKKYRIANTVLEEIQKILKIKPEAKTVKVTKNGSGKGTKYVVDLIE